MTDEEHIQKLIEHRDYLLSMAHRWFNDVRNKPTDENGKRNVAHELGEYSGWLERAQKTTEMIEALKKGKRPAKAPAAPKPRRRHLNLA